MKIEKIKPIPKYINKLIKKVDLKFYPVQDGRTRFYSYFTKNNKELVNIIVAVRNYRGKWYSKQVAVHGIDSSECFVKDTALTFLGNYIVDWYEEGISKRETYSYSGCWWNCEDKYFNMWSICVNRDYVLKQDEFRYCAIKQYTHGEDIKFLRLYREYPEIEYLVKANLNHLATKKSILKQAHKDKAFRKWIFRNKQELSNSRYYVQVILKAYRTNQRLEDIQRFEEAKMDFRRDFHHDYISRYITDIKKFIEYVNKKDISYSAYYDYLQASVGLGIDVTLNKNLYPHDFRRWHDIRIDEYRTLMAERDKKKKKQLAKDFKKVAIKYSSLQKKGKDVFVVIIAKSPNDLIREGDILHHCVGKMNYDQKFIREESLIFFIRNKEDINEPFVTLEYSPTKHKILQCYGERDSKPSKDVMNFVNKKWLPYANKQMKKLVA